jgi:hypothetical protein
MATDCSQQLTFWELGSQQLTVDFAGGRVVTDAGLSPLPLLDKQLGVLTTIALRLPEPRNQKLWTHTRETLLTQEVSQILAGYPDGQDAQQLRNDPLFQTLVDVSPDDEQPLASRRNASCSSTIICPSGSSTAVGRPRPSSSSMWTPPMIRRTDNKS